MGRASIESISIDVVFFLFIYLYTNETKCKVGVRFACDHKNLTVQVVRCDH